MHRLRRLRLRAAGGIVLILGAVLMVGLLALAVALWWVSPGVPEPFVDSYKRPLAGSIAEKIYLDINGARQALFIKGRDASLPVLLYVHGGMPDYFLTRRYPTGWDELFTVVWWEQRGAGLSFNAAAAPGTITTEALIADTLALTDWLCRRFGTDRIYLLAHSGGAFIGIQAAARAPHRFHAYVGVAQMSCQAESERLAYEYMLGRFRALGNARMVERLEAAPVTAGGGIPRGYLAVRDAAMHPLGIGTMRGMRSVLTGLLLPSLLFREYTVAEKWRFWAAKARAGVSPVWEDNVRTDLRTSVSALGIPTYFLHGIHDYTVSYALARSYFDRLAAPLKGFYTFGSSAHSPMFEEPDRMCRILREDVLTGSVSLADRG
jgi:pimeloyl-ACP methyl ester carboxylesterase